MHVFLERLQGYRFFNLLAEDLYISSVRMVGIHATSRTGMKMRYLGLRLRVHDVFALLGCCTALVGSLLPTFRDNV
jgi:hypothetical protein